jgi:hypothetical protein
MTTPIVTTDGGTAEAWRQLDRIRSIDHVLDACPDLPVEVRRALNDYASDLLEEVPRLPVAVQEPLPLEMLRAA